MGELCLKHPLRFFATQPELAQHGKEACSGSGQQTELEEENRRLFLFLYMLEHKSLTVPPLLPTIEVHCRVDVFR